ncbi:MAG: ABC transporter ATP-binding protein/permease [Xanthobacteraceae bacterium]
MQNLGKTLAIVWRIAAPYFRSEDKWPGRILLASVIAIELALVGLDVLFNQWYGRFYNALQERNWDTFVSELTYFAVIAAIFIVLAVYQLYLNQWLQIRWRAWMTRRYLGEWLDNANHYRMQLLGDAADNPDQRLTDDIKMFVEQTLNIGIGLLSSVVTLFSFFVILWGLSAAAPLHLFGQVYNVPGYLVWGALVYAVIGTALTHLVGRPLIRLDFMQQRYEADFRFNLVRARENAEQIALLRGESAERNQLLKRFTSVVDNWIAIMIRTKKVTALTASYSQAAKVFPFILVAPAYFADKIQLGGMMQTASAFGSVQGALSFFVTTYRSLAEWRAVVSRLDGFETSIAHATILPSEPDRIVHATANDATIALDDLLLQLPDGKPMVAAEALHLRPGETTLIKGPSGSGKSTLFRAIGGIWPFGTGTIRIPAAARLMFLPQRPYFPVGSLKSAIAYPAEPDAFDSDAVRAAIQTAGLPALADHLDEEAHWNARLSLGEQQRLGLARALLAQPDYLFLDEATASLDEAAEAKLYNVLAAKLPSTTIVSIGHRGTLDTLHAREITLTPGGTTGVAYTIAGDGSRA